MNIKVVDFEELSRNYIKYQDGLKRIAETKKGFINLMNPLKEQMEVILNKSNRGEVITDDERKNYEEWQEKAYQIDDEYKSTMQKMNGELSEEIYKDLLDIINDYSSENDIDMVINKSDIAFNKPEFEITSEIIEVLIQKNLNVIEKSPV